MKPEERSRPLWAAALDVARVGGMLAGKGEGQEMRALANAVVGGALIVLAVGCGSAGTEETVTRAQFLKEVNRLCNRSEEEKFKRIAVVVHMKEAQLKARHVTKAHLTEADFEQLTLGAVLPVFRQMTQELRGIAAPEGDEKRFEAIVGRFERDIEETQAEPRRFIDGVAFEDGNEAARSFGLGQCVF